MASKMSSTRTNGDFPHRRSLFHANVGELLAAGVDSGKKILARLETDSTTIEVLSGTFFVFTTVRP